MIVKKEGLKKQAATYVPTNEICSIISDEELSFWVRNGARRDLFSITMRVVKKTSIVFRLRTRDVVPKVPSAEYTVNDLNSYFIKVN